MNVKTSPNINYCWANLMIEELVRNGTNTFCVSSGSRSSPLTLAAATHAQANTYVHLDERASAFRALGYVSATHRPCVIITTSGTAVANLLPAVIEAFKKKIPLIILTADRPPELRFTGAHQTIDQTKLFGSYVRWFFDLPCPTAEIPPEFVLTTIDQAVAQAKSNPGGPVHINCMFREPLAPIKSGAPARGYLKSIVNWQKNKLPYTRYIQPQYTLSNSEIKTVAADMRRIKNGIIVTGKLASPDEQKAVLKLSEHLHWPVFTDLSSGLRLGTKHKNIIHYFDQILLSDKIQAKIKPDGILHLGGRITSKRWYQFIEWAKPKYYLMVINHTLRNDPLHNVTTRIHCSVKTFCASLLKDHTRYTLNKHLTNLQKANQKTGEIIEQVLHKEHNLNEPLVARVISGTIAKNSGLFLANSMPVRDMDMYSSPNGQNVVIGGNRGASGIDGTIATACGFSNGLNKPVTLLIGDLAFLYDLNALDMVRRLKTPMVIVVLNNNGGGIFSFLPVHTIKQGFEQYFGTPHDLTFHAAADQFHLNYACPDTLQEFLKIYKLAQNSPTSTIIEIRSDRRYNFKLHQKLQTVLKIKLNKLT